MKTNILVQYDGGGYDGCIWEWNFFYIDKDGTFHDIHSSGSGRITTKLVAMLLIENNGNSFSNKVYVYHLDNEDELKDFATETNGGLVKGIVRWFNNRNDPDAEPFAVCKECGTLTSDADEIHVVDAETICYECYGCGTCDCCGEYVGENLYRVDEYDNVDDDTKYPNRAAQALSDDGYYNVCEYCFENAVDGIREDDQQDLLHASLCTGKPDMFSDEMRWHWGC